MAKLNPQELSFKQLISQDKIYKIPQYQRNYSWTKENWEDLWEDILGIEDQEDKHYMGPIVLKEVKKTKDIEIIDGQQRFCSITLIVLATISILTELVSNGVDVEENEDLIKEIKENYIGKEGRLSPKRKLFLNKYDDPFFSTNLVEPYKVEPQKRDILPSHNELKEAFKYFKKKLESKFAKKSGLDLANFIHDTVMENLSFIVIYVTDEDNAYAIFETLNARGLELSNTDLLKNYLFSLVQNDSDDLKFIEARWDKIIDIIGFKALPSFMRYYWNAHHKYVNDSKLFREIKNNAQLKSSEQIKEFFEQLEISAKIYDALSDPDHSFWRDKAECIDYIEELKILDSKVFKILALALYEKLPTEIHKLLKLCSVISLRYYIADKNPNEIERLYSDLAIKLSKGEITRFSRIKNELKNLYIKDEFFISNFSNRIIKSKSNKTRLKHILIKIESNVEEKEIANSTKLSIEHILPETFAGDWNSIFENEAADYIYRLGNYTLLTNTDNRKCGAKSFEVKKTVYSTSRYKIAKQLCELDTWNKEQLELRQVQLANIAKDIWKVDFD